MDRQIEKNKLSESSLNKLKRKILIAKLPLKLETCEYQPNENTATVALILKSHEWTENYITIPVELRLEKIRLETENVKHCNISQWTSPNWMS